MKQIASAGNTVVPAILTLEKLGFAISVEREGQGAIVRAMRDGECYLADDPVAVLGLVKLIEIRNWEWSASDREIDEVMGRYGLE